MRILVDAMGGDNAPDQIALGAIQAAKDFGCEVVLVGRGEAILRALKDQGIETLPKGVEIANADDVVDMHDDPATVVKKKKDSSMVVGLNMLKEGGGDAFVSAGSTGALLSAATLTVRPCSSTAARRATARRNFCCNLRSWARITPKRCWVSKTRASRF